MSQSCPPLEELSLTGHGNSLLTLPIGLPRQGVAVGGSNAADGDPWDFVLNGTRIVVEADDVRNAVRDGAPEGVREHWVDVDGVRWPPKQVLALATGLSRQQFTSHVALRQLQRLGFQTSASAWSGATREPNLTAMRAAKTAQPEAPDHSATTGRIVMVGCSQTKAAAAAPARELFTGELFRKARAHAEELDAPWYVLSAKFGLLDPEEVVSPYDVFLGEQSGGYRSAWGQWVVAQLAERERKDEPHVAGLNGVLAARTVRAPSHLPAV